MLIHFEIDRQRYFIFMGHNLGGIIIKQVRIKDPDLLDKLDAEPCYIGALDVWYPKNLFSHFSQHHTSGRCLVQIELRR